MNLYILNDVLHDYTSGMCVIVAESMKQCEELFIEKFAFVHSHGSIVSKVQEDFKTAEIQVIENVNYPSGVVSYVYGGG